MGVNPSSLAAVATASGAAPIMGGILALISPGGGGGTICPERSLTPSSSEVEGGGKSDPSSSEGEVFWVMVQVIFLVNGKCCSRQIIKPSLDVRSSKAASGVADS
jgi:hypothetical protein